MALARGWHLAAMLERNFGPCFMQGMWRGSNTILRASAVHRVIDQSMSQNLTDMKCWPPLSPFLNLPYVIIYPKYGYKPRPCCRSKNDRSGAPIHINPTIPVRWNQKNWVSCKPCGCRVSIYAHSKLLELWELCS